MGSGQGARDAKTAAAYQSQLFRQYAEAGRPGLIAALGYARNSYDKGLPSYVQSAYDQARVGALEQNISNTRSLRERLLSNVPDTASGGQYLSGLASVASSGGDAYARELTQIRTSNAVAGIEQRNKLLNILAGGAATGTNLAASFGQLGNQAISLEPQSPGYGLGIGALSAGLGAYASLSQPRSSFWGNNYQYGYDPTQAAGALSRLPLG